MTSRDKEQPYKPSWIDRFTDWVGRLPIRALSFYLAFGLVLFLVQMLALWLEGGLREVELLPVIIFNAWAVPFLLALIYFLDGWAKSALSSTRSVLDTTTHEFDQHEFMLSNMPFLAPLIAGLAMTVLAILIELMGTTPIRYRAFEQLRIFTAVFHVIDKSSAFLFGIFIYHTIRQLRMVNAINLHHVRINIFNLKPLQAFSRLSASTAVALVAGMFGWLVINPELLADPVSFGFAAGITLLAVTFFVWPLYGVHRRLEAKKERALHENDVRFEAIFSRFNQRFREEDYSEITTLNATISSLEVQHRRIAAIPTWPWRPETARIALTAITLPFILMILQLIVQRAI